MLDESPVNSFLAQLCEGYTQAEVAEIELYLALGDWKSLLHKQNPPTRVKSLANS
jgi:hypothetical protein